MKSKIFFFTFILCSQTLFAQTADNDSIIMPLKKPHNVALNIGVLMGGGSLIGADFEYMPSQRFGLQAGIGISSFGLGLNYHLSPKINSSFISIVYWNQGFGDNFYASYLGPIFTFRAKKIFQASLGYGLVLQKGNAIKGTQYENMTGSLLYNIGIFFPL